MTRPARSGQHRPVPEIAPGHVAIGRIAGAFGVHGELKVEPLAPRKQFSCGLKVRVGERECAIERVRGSGRFIYVTLKGLSVREEAQAMRGEYLQARESDLLPLPEGQYYRYQLIGLAVRGSDGRNLGRIEDVMSTPESDVFVVRGPLGEVLVPATGDIVLQVDVPSGAVTVEVVPGLLPGG